MIPRFRPSLGIQEFLKILNLNIGAVKKFEKKFTNNFIAIDAVAFPYGRSA